jgi:hypothetical protein
MIARVAATYSEVVRSVPTGAPVLQSSEP